MAEEFTEKVTFEADGIDAVGEQVKRLGDEAAAAHARQVALAKALADPAYRRALDNTRRLAEANRRSLTPEVRRLTASEQARTEILRRDRALRSGAFLREQRQRDTLRRAAESVQRREQAIAQQEQLHARRRDAASGQYVKRQRERLAAARQIEAVEREERRAVLDAAYGRRLGGAVAFGERNGGRLMAAGGALAAAGGAGLGMARGGFEGTVEGNKLALEIQLIQREFANSLRPAMMWFTRQLESVRKVLEKLGPAGQQAIAALTIGAAGVGGAALAAGAASRFLTGDALLPAIQKMMTKQAVATAAANAAGSFAGEVVGGAAGGAAASRLGGGAAAGGAGASRLGGMKGKLMKGGIYAAAAYGAYNEYEDIQSRGGGWKGKASQLIDTATFKEEVGWIAKLVGLEKQFNETDDFFKKSIGLQNPGAGERSQVRLADAGFEAGGSAYERFNVNFGNTDTSEANSPAAKQEETNGLLRTMISLMQEQMARQPIK